MLWTLVQVYAYDLTQKDIRFVTKIETRIFSILDEKEEDLPGKILDKIDDIQDNTNKKRLISILESLELSIDRRYEIATYAVVSIDTPVLYTPDFKSQFWGTDGLSLNFDNHGEMRPLEFTALPGTVFEVKETLENNIYKVVTRDYPVAGDLYIHNEFISELKRSRPDERIKKIASRDEIIERLRSIIWYDYVWWGNTPSGIPQLLDIFPPNWKITDTKKEEWQLRGVDCSGLLYWATDWFTPRNTSWLVEYWENLDIAGKTLEEIIPMLEPLDVIVWKGHMMMVLDDIHTIESAISYTDPSLSPWVQIRETTDSLWEVMQERTPVNNYSDSQDTPFVIMRWYNH